MGKQINTDSDKRTTVIFDFDGTVADTFDKVIDIINRNPGLFGIDGIDKSEIPRLRALSSRYLLKEFNVNLVKVPKFINLIKAELANEITDVTPFENILNVIKAIKDKGYRIGILTSNDSKNVRKFLKHYNFDEFEFIRSEKHYFSKQRSLKRLVSEFELDKENTYYVGDEVRDIKTARESGVHSVAVTWGYNSEEILKENKPDFIVYSPEELLDIF